MRNSKQHLFTVAFVGCLWLALILGCTRLKESSKSGETTSPATSPTNTATTSSSPARSATNNSPNAGIPSSTAGLTLANYNRLQNGMTYPQVVQILGKEGEQTGVLEGGGDKVVVYKWDADEKDSDATMTAFFKNGKLDSKLQFGLK